jgi:hypothetical protein
MDSMRGLLAGNDERLDGAIEAPPVVGVDERRMQVRAYNFWAAMLGDRAYPSVEDLDIEEIEDFGPHSVLLDFTAGIEDPAIAYLGERLRAESELDEDVQYISQVPSRSVLSRLTDHYLQIIANRAPIGFEAEFVNERGVTIMYRGILLPFSSDDDTIDFIMGVINWKEAVAVPQAEELLLEVEQALRAPATAPLNAPVPVWADGPDSEHIDDVGGTELGFAGYADDDGVDYVPASAVTARYADIGEEEPRELDADADLADWLALARETAVAAQAADSRSRTALYGAVARCYDFVLAAEDRPEALAELLEDAGLTAQDRAPMTPVVKLVFGAAYDKTRVAEYACVLGHAREAGLGRGELAPYLDSYPGGLKALVRDERARKRGDAPARSNVDAAAEKLAEMAPVAMLPIAGEEDYVLLIARRVDADHVGLVATVTPDDAVWRKLAAKARPLG